MKRILVIILLSVCSNMLFAQPIYKSFQYNGETVVSSFLKDFLLSQGEVKPNENVCICVVNRLSHKDGTCQSIDEYIEGFDIGLFEFFICGADQFSYVLLKYKNNYDCLSFYNLGQVNRENEFSDVIKYLISYFERYPDIDRRLMPYYLGCISDLYLSNTMIEGNTMWEDWHRGSDALRVPDKYKYGIDRR